MAGEDIYERKISSKIKLKGISKLYKKKKKESHESDGDEKASQSQIATAVPGTGRVVSSGSTLQGFETKFVEEVSVNDTIVIEHPQTHGIEERLVESVISNRTLAMNEPFSVDVITTIPYSIRKAAAVTSEGGPNPEYSVVNTKKQVSTISIREKTGMWTYKTVTKSVKGNLSAEDKLNERIKNSRDKFCW